MVDTVQQRRQIAWRAETPVLSHALLPAGMLVGGIIGLVALAAGALAWHGGSMILLWVLFGVALAWVSLRRLAGPKAQVPHAVASAEPVAVRRDGTVVYRDKRRHQRIVPTRRGTTLYLMEGRTIAARIIDLSIAGVAVETRMTERELSAVTQVGSRGAALIRQTPTGAVFGFDTLLDATALNAGFQL